MSHLLQSPPLDDEVVDPRSSHHAPSSPSCTSSSTVRSPSKRDRETIVDPPIFNEASNSSPPIRTRKSSVTTRATKKVKLSNHPCCHSFKLVWTVLVLIVLLVTFALVGIWVLNASHAAVQSTSISSEGTHSPSITSHPKQDSNPNHDPNTKSHFVPLTYVVGPEMKPTSEARTTHPLDPHSSTHLYRSQQRGQMEHRRRFEQLKQIEPERSAHEFAASDSHQQEMADYLFLRSTPRLRTKQFSTNSTTYDSNQTASITIIAPAIPMDDPLSVHSSLNFARANVTAFNSSHPRHVVTPTAAAVPFLVHCKTPATSQWRAHLQHAISQADAGGYHIEKYVQVGNYLLVPNDSQQSNKQKLLTTLDRLKPNVINWHEYESQDKIEPWLFDNCKDTHSMIHDYIRDCDSPTFDLTVSLFHTLDHPHANHTISFATVTERIQSIHRKAPVVPSSTRAIVAKWQEELVKKGDLWKEIYLEIESSNLILVQIPLDFFHQQLANKSHPASNSSASPSFCDLLLMFASYPYTEYVEQSAAFETHNKYASPLIQTGTYQRPGTLYQHGLTGRNQVITVADTGVAHGNCFFRDPLIETPIDTVNFNHRKIVSYVNTRGKNYDLPAGHGSHTAASIAGHILPEMVASAESEQDAATLAHLAQYNGVAYEAKLAVFDVNDGLSTGKIKPPKDIYAKYYQLAYDTMNARISSNSWGSKNGSYIVECRETDRFVFDHPDFLPIFSSGNYGERGYQSVVAPGTAKNCLTIGAIGNVKIKSGVSGPFFCAARVVEPKSSPGYREESDALSAAAFLPTSKIEFEDNRFVDEGIYLRRLYSFISGAGPTYDARFKPELLAPGHYIISARSEGAPELDTCKDCERSLMSLFGTSMSAAIAAGSASLARQYFVDGFYPTGYAIPTNSFIPSAALLKAILLSSAVTDIVESGISEGNFEELDPHLGYYPAQTGPTPKSGFGRIQLDRSLKLTGNPVDLWVLDQKKIETGDFHAWCFRIRKMQPTTGRPYTNWNNSTASSTFTNGDSSGLLPFRASLVWTDPPASLSASWLLINNLDLSVSDLQSGSVWIGNQHWTDTDPLYDSTNNVEQVHVPTHLLQSGSVLSVHVRGTSVPQGPQPYALVVTGSFEQLPVQSCAGGVVCPLHCSNRGVCSESGVCRCPVGFGGVGCEIISVALPFCTAVQSSVPFGKWSYLHFDIDPPASPTSPPQSIRVLMHSIAGEPDLYISHAKLPSLQDHDYAHLLSTVNSATSSSHGTSDQLVSQVDIPVSLPGRYYIGVYGYCCLDESQFQIEAFKCESPTIDPPRTIPYTTGAPNDFSMPTASRPCTCRQG